MTFRNRRSTCDTCLQPFGPDRERAKDTPNRCKGCDLQRRRSRAKEHYELCNQYRLGTRPGRRPGQRMDQAMAREEMAERLRMAREAHACGDDSELPRSLPRTCLFCLHNANIAELHASYRCEQTRDPDESGGCDAWVPRYKTMDDDDADVERAKQSRVA